VQIGFSTGAVARGDYRRALDVLQHHHVNVVELSALRMSELEPLVNDLGRLDLARFSFISFHSPSTFEKCDELRVVELLRVVIERHIPVIVHPDAISDFRLWREFGELLLVENMDKRKPIGRTATEMAEVFLRLPEAGFCFDIGHARQVDPTMVESFRLLDEHGSRLRQVHMSEVNTASHHEPMSSYAIHAFQRVAAMIADGTPVILETLIDRGQSNVPAEIEKAMMALTVPQPLAIAG
jgi:hypothetical protein